MQGGTITVKRSKGMVLLEIKHLYRFGEVVKLTPEQAAELAEKLRLEAGKCRSK